MATALLRPRRGLAPPSKLLNTTINSLNLSSLFLQLPATYRSFHASPRPQFLDAGVATAHALFDTLHASTGLPWAYSIPLAALTIRTTLILPISIYSRRVIQKQASLTPLVQSWQHVLRQRTMHESAHLGPHAVQRALLLRIRRKRSEIYARWGCPVWKTLLPLAQLPVWVTAVEAVRAMCGTGVGLLGMVMRTENSADAVSDGIREAMMEPSFATEGALWFPDLLVPDPYLVLPFMLSGVVLLNLTNSRASAAGQSAWQRGLQRSLKAVALLLGPLTLQMPSAVLVYWISSSMFAYLQSVALDKAMPMPPRVKPCDPPARRKERAAAKAAGEKETSIGDGM